MAVNEDVCRHDHCGLCCGSSCVGCGSIELTRGEIGFLLKFAQLPFLPAAADTDCKIPVYIGESFSDGDDCSQIIRLLEAKKLIRVDYDIPLANFDYSEYESFPLHGSMALTLRGQQAIDQIRYMGLDIGDE